MTDAPRPGWYPDPAGTPLFRWWDGEAWTHATSEQAGAPAPAVALRVVENEAEPRPRTRSAARAALVLTVGFALLITASAGFGWLLWRDPPVAPAAGDPAVVGPTGALQAQTRVATIGRVSMTLPGDPYELQTKPQSLPGVFDLVFEAHAVVHPRYDGVHPWSAVAFLARVAPTARKHSVEAQAEGTLDQLSTAIFARHPTTVRDVHSSAHAVDGENGARISADVHYRVPGLPSRSDRLTLLVIGLDDGSYVVAATAVPQDADPELTQLAAAALESVSVR